MYLWRISNYADLKGLGGFRAGGRWHFPGQPVVYLAEHPALAFLEILVHHEVARIEDLPKQYQLLQVEVPESVAFAFMAGVSVWRGEEAEGASEGEAGLLCVHPGRPILRHGSCVLDRHYNRALRRKAGQ